MNGIGTQESSIIYIYRCTVFNTVYDTFYVCILSCQFVSGAMPPIAQESLHPALSDGVFSQAKGVGTRARRMVG